MFGVVSMPVSFSPLQAQKPPVPEYRNDTRLASLRQFFERGSCPAASYAATFLEVADELDLDWRLLPSISYLESTGGKASPYNNLFGWDSGRAQFSSPIAAIHTVGNYLAHSYLYRDKGLDEVLAIYNPVADYGQRVKSVMRQIAPVQ
jgi:hypothetical protein